MSMGSYRTLEGVMKSANIVSDLGHFSLIAICSLCCEIYCKWFALVITGLVN